MGDSKKSRKKQNVNNIKSHSSANGQTPQYKDSTKQETGVSADIQKSASSNLQVQEYESDIEFLRQNINGHQIRRNQGVKKKGSIDELRQEVWNAYQNQRKWSFQVWNIFTDIGKLIYGSNKPTKSKRVHFPPDVVQKANEKGEINAGGENIPLAKNPFKSGFHALEKSKTIRIYKNPEFAPKLIWLTETTTCEAKCEKVILTCSCLNLDYETPQTKIPKEEEPQKLSAIAQAYMAHISAADNYIDEHLSTTLHVALEEVDGLWKLYSNDSNIRLATSSANISLSSLCVGQLAAKLWVWANCIPLVFLSQSDCPEQDEFRQVLETFVAFLISAQMSTKVLIQESRDFFNYASECVRVIKNLEINRHVNLVMDVPEPRPALCPGYGLNLVCKPLKKGQKQQIEIYVTEKQDDDDDGSFKEQPEWENFQDLRTSKKLSALDDLMQEANSEFEHARNQVHLLIDDIKETTADMSYDMDLLYRLSEVYNCISHIVAIAQSRDDDLANREITLICDSISQFLLSLKCFIRTTEHVMKRLMEAIDMVNLVGIYMEECIKIPVFTFVPGDFVKKSTPGKKRESFCTCRAKKTTRRKKVDVVDKRCGKPPKLIGADLFNIPYEDIFNYKVLEGVRYTFRMEPSQTQTWALENPPRVKFKLREIGRSRLSKVFLPQDFISAASIVAVLSEGRKVKKDSKNSDHAVQPKPILKQPDSRTTSEINISRRPSSQSIRDTAKDEEKSISISREKIDEPTAEQPEENS